MKKLLLITLFILILSGCTKTEIKEVIKEVQSNSISDSTYVKFYRYPPGSTVLSKYVIIDFQISYKISNFYLPISGYGFVLYNTLIIDNGTTQYTWSSKQLRYRSDTLTFKYDSRNWLPKTSVKFYSEIGQMISANEWYSIAKSEILQFPIAAQ